MGRNGVETLPGKTERRLDGDRLYTPTYLEIPAEMKPVVARFDAEHVSTDGGTLLLKALDERLTLTEDLAACLPAQRDPRKVQHALRDLLRQRVFGLACGYEDCHDAA